MTSSSEHFDRLLKQLRVGATSERLAAARHLAQFATSNDVEVLERARRRELDHYVSVAIDEAIALATPRPPRPSDPTDPVDDALEDQPWDDEVYAQALRAATTSLVHELRRPLGLARLAVERNDLRATSAFVERMDRLLDAMEHLVFVSAGGEYTGFDLGELVAEIVEEQEAQFSVPIHQVDPHEVKVSGDRGAVELIVRNGLSNACESTLQLGSLFPAAVAVSSGRTDRDAWVAIIDHGAGMPAGFDPFAFAATRKDGHLGVGLALARQAARSMNGDLSLTQREDGGVTLRLSWPLGQP